MPRHTNPVTNPVPKLLIWGLLGGIVLFTLILIVIFLSRETSSSPDSVDLPHSSESRSASPPQ